MTLPNGNQQLSMQLPQVLDPDLKKPQPYVPSVEQELGLQEALNKAIKQGTKQASIL